MLPAHTSRPPPPPTPQPPALWFMTHFLAGTRFALPLGPCDSSAPELSGLGPAAPHPTSMMTPAQDILHSSPCWPMADPVCYWCDSPCPALAPCAPLGAAKCRLLTPLILEFWSPMAWPCPAPLVPWSSEPMASCPCPACHRTRAKPPVGCPEATWILVWAWLPRPACQSGSSLSTPRCWEHGLATLAAPG